MELLQPDVRRIAPPDPAPAADRIEDGWAAGTPEPLKSELTALLGADRVLTRVLDLVKYASDASPYRLLPRAVVMARDADDVAKTLAHAREKDVPVTFRAGGTSLNGQAQTDGILVDVRRHWTGVAIEDDGARVRVRPGTVLGRVNHALAPYSRRIGPDPASTDIACVGGVIANNSGGMRCGVVHDTYQTLRAMKLVLPSGTVVDTEAPDAEERFAAAEPELAQGLIQIRDEIRADPELSERIRRKFQIKNTMGYRLCAFLDADTPLEIFRRLVVGSEGTLAFVAEAVFETVPHPRGSTAAVLIFPDIDTAVASVPPLVESGATAVELMLALTLKAAQSFVTIPQEWEDAPWDAAAILVEFRSDDPAELAERQAAAEKLLEEHPLVQPAKFSTEPEVTELYWRVREGMHGLVGRMRPPHTALIVEDVCVAPERIAEAAKDVRELLGEHGFLPGVAGHASAGNLHFMLTPEFAQESERERYEGFMEALVELIVGKYDGSLKAEHGTGVNMAPFVEREWGAKATEMMRRVKRLADPDGVLAPGVILNDDPGCHLRNLKTTPPIEEDGGADLCVECGFCEPVCPSRDLTTTPRQRIVLRREMARQPAGSPVLEALLDQYEYDGIQTCAADGTCALACPLGIDTGVLVKSFRAREHSARSQRAGVAAAKRWATVERASRAGLRARPVSKALSRAGRALLSDELVPSWPAEMPPPAPSKLPPTRREGAAALYLPACINRIFGPSLPEALVRVSERAGVPLWIPPDVAGHCCAVPWSSKGLIEGADWMAAHTAAAVKGWLGDSGLPVVTDASSCTHGFHAILEGIEVLDSIRWVHDRVLPGLEIPQKAGAVAVHPPCSARHMALVGQLRAVASAMADEVVVPATATCCGMAGDRGLLHPELARSATRPQVAELDARHFDAHISSNRTCEIGLEIGTGRKYRSFVHLLDELAK
ncbi:MAG TPA: FAD-binding and (Fe-S)-binding domain-containing protein [Thermoleophilaceae bacterium]|nr:FAD-binding and (Fe-S)-binding domain-containing protein [Thermoleophilaceae bacterium]